MSVERNPDTDSQAAPVINDRPYIQDMVIADIETRKQFGIAKYGTALQAGNGRDMLLDAYEEALDLVIYLRGALEERVIRGTVDDEHHVLIVYAAAAVCQVHHPRSCQIPVGDCEVHRQANLASDNGTLPDPGRYWVAATDEDSLLLIPVPFVRSGLRVDAQLLMTPSDDGTNADLPDPGWEGEAGVPQTTTNPYYRDPPLPVWDRVKKWLRRE